ncbi:hypothetical protein NBO_28g0014 [Nosema bombycis CQ1]|uniref:Uncharacterized protein n=1 Tax=Nosema bombycis (strain CQ1 / CVCC 102059) TaxID=578461 RepID=R0MJK9_NOSB1|nr:hypothetical protein NBO_28g0014 [Nosema bombycis CQ1]|eukprot:EOB14375.1 hypothetical protein NBO_28g0014 [Nosema bombycis CQ1]
MRLLNPTYEESTSHRLKTFLYTSITDTFVVERICRCIYRGQLSLYTIFTAKIIYDKVYLHKEQDNTLPFNNSSYIQNHFLVFIACVIIASKSYMDLSYTNISWTELCHFPVNHINKTERIVLQIIDYDVIIPFKTLEAISISYGCVKETQKIKQKKCAKIRRFISKIFSPFMCLN